MHYEIYVKPERGPNGGPCTVQERDSYNRDAWTDKAEAIRIAQSKKVSYPHMDFLVHELATHTGARSLVYDTSEAPVHETAAALLLSTGRTLNQVDDMVHTGQISEATANAFFRAWAVGKCEFRWNAELQQPEELIYSKPYTNDPPEWRRMPWG